MVPLTLVSAAFDDGPNVTLAFDRAIDVTALDGAAVVVDDPVVTGVLYEATGGPVLLDPATVRITLNAIGDPSGTDVRLTAGAGNGIVAVDDGGAWAGAINLLLPFS